jgi:hypothetical protein
MKDSKKKIILFGTASLLIILVHMAINSTLLSISVAIVFIASFIIYSQKSSGYYFTQYAKNSNNNLFMENKDEILGFCGNLNEGKE